MDFVRVLNPFETHKLAVFKIQIQSIIHKFHLLYISPSNVDTKFFGVDFLAAAENS